MASCVLLLDKHTYIAGEEITGRVEIANSNSVNIRDISLTIEGSGKVKWNETESYTENGENKSRTVTYSSHEQYLSSRTVLYGQVNGPKIQLPPGSHSFDFKCYLPPELPGTINGQYGSIEYKAKVKFDIPWSFDDKFVKEFYVLPRIDLNSDPSLILATQTERVKNYCTWKCSTSPAIITVTLPKSGFMRGEEIPISVHISNLSHVDMEGIQTKLEKDIHFKSQTPRSKTKSESSTVVHKRFDLMSKSKDRIIQLDSKLLIPSSTPITCNRTIASIISVSYHVKVDVYVSGCHNTAKIYIPVTIGSIPLRGTNTVQSQQPSPHAPHAPLAPMPPVMPLESMPVMPPPLPTMPMPGHSPINNPTAPISDETAPPPSYSEVVYGWKSGGETEKK